jgi:hypothetical protein
MNQKAAYALRSMATFAFMGGAGITSIGDFGRIVMQYELTPMMKGIKSMIDMDTLRMSGEETKLSGSAMEYTLGMYRLEAPISNNFVAPKLLNSAQHAFYIMNGLTPITIAFKKLSGLVMGHTIVDLSIKMANGTCHLHHWDLQITKKVSYILKQSYQFKLHIKKLEEYHRDQNYLNGQLRILQLESLVKHQ